MKRIYLFLLNHLKEIILGLKGSNSFVKNVAYNLSGNTIVLIIGFFLTPIIAKIYGPKAYGGFAVFTSICSFFQPISTFQFPTGYVAAKNRLEFYILIRLSFYVLFLTTLILLISAIFYSEIGGATLSTQLIYSVPVYVFFGGLFFILKGWNIKLEEFKKAAKAKVFATVLGKTATVAIGSIILASPLGLVIGSILAFISESIALISSKLKTDVNNVIRVQITFNQLVTTLKKYKQYPTFVTFNSIISTLGTQIPIYFLAYFYDAEKVGLYSLSASLILIPINLTGTSIASVFLAKISRVIDLKKDRNKIVLSLYNKMLYPSLIGLIVLSLILKYGLTILVGNDWIITSQISSFIALSFSFTMVSIPLSVIYRLIHQEKINFNLTIVFVLIYPLSLLLGWYFGGFLYSIYFYFLVNLSRQAIQIIILFKRLEINYSNVIRDLIFLSLLYTFAFYLIIA